MLAASGPARLSSFPAGQAQEPSVSARRAGGWHDRRPGALLPGVLRRRPALPAHAAMGGRGAGEGIDLSGRLAAAASRTTLIRLVRAMPDPAVSASPRVLGWTSSRCARDAAGCRSAYRPCGMRVVRQGEFCLTETVLSPSITRTRSCRVEAAYPRQMVDRTSRRSARRAEGRRARRAAAAPAGRCS
jgi:hypothetical protein